MPEVFNPIITHLYANQDGSPKEVTRYNDAIISEINVDNTKYDFGGLYNENMFSGNRVWNQLAQNGNFADGTTGWTANNCSVSVTSGTVEITPTDETQDSTFYQYNGGKVAGHKYLATAMVKTTNDKAKLVYGDSANYDITQSNKWQLLAVFFTEVSTARSIFVRTDANNNGDAIYAKNIMLFDLTDIYGAGNEPSTYAEFYHDYKDDYYPYNAGTSFSTATKLLNTIKQPVKSATFYGSTKKWNQLVQNGNFSDTSSWSTAGASFSVSNNVATITNTNGYSYARINTLVKRVIEHKYFAVITARTATNGGGGNNYFFVNQYLDGNSGSTVALFSQSIGSSWTTLSTVYTATTSSETSLVNVYPNNQGSAQVGDSTEVKNFMIVDLTAIYGAGNEPTASEFLSSLKKDYYPYSNGEIASVYRAFTAINGLNIWDEQWEVGWYDVNTGGKKVDNTRIRCKNPIRVLPNTTYFANKALTYLEYDGSGAFTGYFNYLENEPRTFTTHSDTVFITFYPTASYGTTYNNDICISISDPSVNGVYEAYKPTQLIRCYGINLWDEQWEEGSINNSGQFAPTATIRSKNYTKVIPNTVYYITNKNFRICYYDEDKVFISRTVDEVDNVFTTPENCEFIKITGNVIYGTTYLNNICINISESGVDGTYYPYREYSKLSGVGDFNDTLVVNSDGTGSYTKLVGTYTFDGTEDWQLASPQTSAGMYKYLLYKDIGMKNGLLQDGSCNAFENLGAGYNSSTKDGLCFGLNNIYLYFITATEKTKAEVQAIFNSSVTIVYPLETEVSTQLTQQEVEYVLNGAITYSPYSTLSIGNENEVPQTNEVEIWGQR